MRTLLHIRTRPDDALEKRIQAEQQGFADHKVLVEDLTKGPPDYGGLLVKIFEADSVQVW
jgi:hypothetical protein